MTTTILPDLLFLKSKVFDALLINFEEYFKEPESNEYSACGFSLNKKLVSFRSAKVTPKKAGQFVTLWKRNNLGTTAPFSEIDNVDFVMILANNGILKGLFIFPKALLVEKKIFSTNKTEGKRGFRVYPTWDLTESKQARQTQAWQVAYFMEIKEHDSQIDQSLLVKFGLGE